MSRSRTAGFTAAISSPLLLLACLSVTPAVGAQTTGRAEPALRADSARPAPASLVMEFGALEPVSPTQPAPASTPLALADSTDARKVDPARHLERGGLVYAFGGLDFAEDPGTGPQPAPETIRPIEPPALLRRVPSLALARTPRPVPKASDDPAVGAIVANAARSYNVDEALIWAVMRQESGGHRYAVSPAGACSYMQLMPATARRFGVTNIFDAEQNINAGARYLRLLLTMFNEDVSLALAGYNAGEGRVVRSGYRVPQIPETMNYVRSITSVYRAPRHVGPNSR